jgi:hypothetical protein
LRSTKALAFKTAFFEAAPGSTGAWIVATELFDQLFILADNALTALDLSFAVENPSGVCSSTQKLKS